MDEASICIHGYNVKVKGRNFKRRSTMLKHGRFLKNLSISPVYPKIAEDDEGGAEEGEAEQVEDEWLPAPYKL